MRKETRKICSAFINNRPARAARTYTDGYTIWLHNHAIAWWDFPDNLRGKRVLHMNCCGYATTTTKERLNGLLTLLGLGSQYFTSNHQLYFGSKLRPVDSHETITIDVDLALELMNDNTPFHHHTIAA
jgi:hypothetical protein